MVGKKNRRAFLRGRRNKEDPSRGRAERKISLSQTQPGLIELRRKWKLNEGRKNACARGGKKPIDVAGWGHNAPGFTSRGRKGQKRSHRLENVWKGRQRSLIRHGKNKISSQPQNRKKRVGGGKKARGDKLVGKT